MMSYQRAAHSDTGFSLIEFMVALLLGTIIIGGAVSVYLASKRSYTEVERFADMSENGRFALQLLNYSIRHVGFFGASNAGDVRQGSGLGSVNGDCAGDAAAFDTTRFLAAVRADASGNAYGCVTDAVPSSDVLVIKSARPSPRYDNDPDDPNDAADGVISFRNNGGVIFESDSVYLIANSEAGLLIDGDDTPKPGVAEGDELALGAAWPYAFEIYYIQDLSVPTLSRKVLVRNGGAWDVTTEQLVRGLETMNFRFGLDDPGDGDWEIDTFTNFAGVTDWSQVASVELFLLVRSADEDPAYVDTKTYQVADRSITPGGNVHRTLLRSTVTLRNPDLMLRGG